MTNINVNEDDFKKSFPEFSEVENIEFYIMRAQCYVSPNNYGILSDEKRKLAIYLFTAHLLTLQKNIAEGQTAVGLTASASIDRVSVSMVPPPSFGAFEYWLNQTQYGAELLALLEIEFSTPLLLGGSFIRTLL